MTLEELLARAKERKRLKEEVRLAKRRVLMEQFYERNPEYRKKWRAEPEHRVKDTAYQRRRFSKYPFLKRDYHFRYRYGITLAQRDEMLTLQGNACKICKTVVPLGKGWMVDHCHISNRVRGILCHNCNVGLGAFLDNPDRLRAAANYLEKLDEPSSDIS